MTNEQRAEQLIRKYGINFDVQCMIDVEWIDSLKNGGMEGEYVRIRREIMENFVTYYADFEAEDEWKRICQAPCYENFNFIRKSYRKKIISGAKENRRIAKETDGEYRKRRNYYDKHNKDNHRKDSGTAGAEASGGQRYPRASRLAGAAVEKDGI